MKILLGTSASGPVEFEYIPFHSHGMLIQGISNSRKTSLVEEIASQFFEAHIENFGRVQTILFDLGPEFGRLRKKQETILIVGKEGEIPASVETAYNLGIELRKNRMDTIIQLTSIKSEEDQQNFIDKFLDGFMSLDEPKYWLPCVIVIDEAQKYCTGRKYTSCRDAIVNICERGRKYGVLPILVTQAIKDLYLNARIQLSNRIVGYTTEPGQRDVACEMLTMEKSESKRFMNLNPGEFITWGTNITKQTTQFTAHTTHYTHEEKFSVPVAHRSTVDAARTIMTHITKESVSETVKLASQVAYLGARVKLLQAGGAGSDDIAAIRKAEYTKGWNDANARMESFILRFNKSHNGVFSKIRKPCQITLVKTVHDGKTVFMEDPRNV